MARVCTDLYPAKFSYNRFDGFYMDNRLKMQLDILLKNIANDWDFTIIISGSGEVRVGKSVLAMQIAAYWTHSINKLIDEGKIKKAKSKLTLTTNNFVFDGRKLIEQGNYLGVNFPYSVLIYDEAGADLAGTKIMTQMTQDTMDYLRECGQYNMLNILVLPDFFDLPKPIAVTRSIFLINVDYESNNEGIFKRGILKFYSRYSKKKLYREGKKELNYSAIPYDFIARFYPFYPIDEKEYRNLKVSALKNREKRRNNIILDQRDFSWFLLYSVFGMPLAEISRRTGDIVGRSIPEQTMSDSIQRFYPRG